jgi:hypothetical protein
MNAVQYNLNIHDIRCEGLQLESTQKCSLHCFCGGLGEGKWLRVSPFFVDHSLFTYPKVSFLLHTLIDFGGPICLFDDTEGLQSPNFQIEISCSVKDYLPISAGNEAVIFL